MRPARHSAAALALALAAGASAAPSRPAGGGVLEITASRPRLVLGSDAGADLYLAPHPGVLDVTLTANVGRIEDLRPLPRGGWAARYRPPRETFPQVAIIAAIGGTGSGSVDGWIALPLWGQGEARVRTQPGADIELRIDERTFGPRRADASGVALIPVAVPPGVREAYHGFRPVDLKLPKVPLVHVAVDRPLLPADRPQEVRVRAYVVTPHGTVRPCDPPVLEVSRGTVSAPVPGEAGCFEAVWRLPPGLAGAERVVARVPGSPPAAARVETVAGAPANVALAFEPDRIVAGEVDRVAVSARVLDSAGNQVAEQLVLEADGFELENMGEVAPGLVTALLRVPPGFGGRDRIEVRARAPVPGLVGTRTLPLVAAAPATAEWHTSPLLAVADGASPVPLQLRVRDRFGNPVPGLSPAVRARRGRVLDVAAVGPGEYRVDYRPPRTAQRVTDRVEADIGELDAAADVDLLPEHPAVTLGPRVGLAMGPGFTSAYFAADAAVALPRLAAPLWGTLELVAFGTGGSAPGSPETGGECVALLGGLAWRQETRLGLQLLAEVGMGFVIGSSYLAGGSLAAHLGAGAGWRLPWGMPYVEAQLLVIGNDPAPEMPAFTAVLLGAGVQFDLASLPRRTPLHPEARP